MKAYYVNYCVTRLYTDETDDYQTVVELPEDYVPAQDKGMMQMCEAIAKKLTFYTGNGTGICVKSFSRMDL